MIFLKSINSLYKGYLYNIIRLIADQKYISNTAKAPLLLAPSPADPTQPYKTGSDLSQLYKYAQHEVKDPKKLMLLLRKYHTKKFNLLKRNNHNKRAYLKLKEALFDLLYVVKYPYFTVSGNYKKYFADYEFACHNIEFIYRPWLHLDQTSNNNNFDGLYVQFLRGQRKYNKRRYARVRAISRPSFLAGMSLSTLAVALFWNSTVQSSEWLTAILAHPQINFLILIIYLNMFYFMYSYYWLATLRYWRFRIRENITDHAHELPNWVVNSKFYKQKIAINKEILIAKFLKQPTPKDKIKP